MKPEQIALLRKAGESLRPAELLATNELLDFAASRAYRDLNRKIDLAIMIWSGSGCRCLLPPALPTLFCLLTPSIFDGLMLGLNPFDGGVLEFLLVLAGDESGFEE